MKGKKGTIILWSVFIIWVALQTILVIKYWDMPNHDDALHYVNYAEDCIKLDTWYPAAHNEYDTFVFGPGYVNWLILVRKVFGSYSFARALNLLMNVAMLFEVAFLARKWFDERVSRWASLLYMLTFSNLYLPIALLTDLPFTFLLLTSLVLATSRQLLPLAAAGTLIALANWFRPLAAIFLLVILIHFIIQRRQWHQYVALGLPLVLTVFIIGQAAKERTGHFVYQAVSGGYNLAMSSFDGANGLVNFNGFNNPENEIYLPKQPYSYMERDSLLKTASIQWILNHPAKYLSLLPVKIAALYCEDTWPERVKPDQGFRVVLSNSKGNYKELAKIISVLILKSTVYYCILILFIYYVWHNRHHLFCKKNIYLLLPLLGTAATAIFVITSRYHYPYMFAITIYAAAGLASFGETHRNLHSKTKIQKDNIHSATEQSPPLNT